MKNRELLLISTVMFTLGYIWLNNRTDINRTTSIIMMTSNYSNIPVSDDISLLYELANDTTWIAEKQYITQRQFELNNPSDDIFASYAANYPCFWGESFAWNNKSPNGNPNKMDGGKWLCGVKFLQQPCIVYSFGSNHNYLFEYAYGLIDKCAIYTFDPFHKPTQNDMEQLKLLPNFHFYPWGLSDVNNYKNKRHMYTLNTIMSLLNHTHIDIFKIDIEGWEFPVFHSLDKLNEWPSIGQIEIEIHTYDRAKYAQAFGNMKNEVNNKKQLGDIIELFEKHNFRIFHIEPNAPHALKWMERSLAEYSLIQKDYISN